MVIHLLYFCLFFFLLWIPTAFFLLCREISLTSFTFLGYATGQIALEALFWSALIFFLEKIKGGKIFATTLSLIYLLLRLIEIFLIHLFNLSLKEIFLLLSHETFTGFVTLLLASGLPLFVWGGIFLSLFFILWGGSYFLLFTGKFFEKKCSLILIGTLTSFSLALQFLPFPKEKASLLALYHGFLPFKKTVLSPHPKIWTFSHTLKKPLKEKELLAAVDRLFLPQGPRPNLYVFVVESLRKDAVEKAPFLSSFQKECLPLPLTLSNSNATHLSWFSLFHAHFPYCWSYLMKKHWSTGSIPLYVLKKMGYQIHLFSSADLNYYKMGELLFGKKFSLLDSMHFFSHTYPKKTWQADEEAIEALKKEAQESSSSGHIFIVFLDATHFTYSYPPSCRYFLPDTPCFPIVPFPSSLQGAKNSYQNAVSFVDRLLGDFFLFLKTHQLFDDASIVITGDHGEEFFEEGYLFHLSRLNSTQTEIFLTYKLSNQLPKRSPTLSVTSQMDVFPTLLDSLVGFHPLKGLIAGESLFDATRWPFVLQARSCWKRSPYECAIHNGQQRLLFRFSPKRKIFCSQKVFLSSCEDLWGNSLSNEELFYPALKELFDPSPIPTAIP